MSSIIINLDEDDVIRISLRVAEQIRREIRPMLERALPDQDGPGVEVLSPADAAHRLGVSERHLRRQEAEGKIPRRRRISPGRVVYLLHEIEGRPAAGVVASSRRVLNRTQLAEKLGVNPRTLSRILDRLPPPNPEGDWYEREIDQWLICAPVVKAPRA